MASSNIQLSKIEEFINKNSNYFSKEDLELVKHRLINLQEKQLFFLRILNFIDPSFLFKKAHKNTNYKLIMRQIDYFEVQNNTTNPENLKQSNIEAEMTENLIVPSYKKMINELAYSLKDVEELVSIRGNLLNFMDTHFPDNLFNFIELEKILKEEKDIESARIAVYKNMLSERYFLEEDTFEKPYTLGEIKDLLNNGDLKLSSKIKLGYFIKEYKSLIDFEEFNRDFKDFL